MRYMTTGDVMDRFGITRNTICNWRKHKGFPAPIVGSPNRYLAEEVDAWETRTREGQLDA